MRSAKELQRLMQWHYASIRLPRLGRPLAWVTSGAPVELLRAAGVVAVYPENYGALCGAQHQAVALCQKAESEGYSPDLCSYARTSLGSVIAPESAPLGGLPRPDLLIACNNICSTVVKWYETLSDRFQVPLFVLDLPFIHDRLTPAMTAYAVTQLRDLVTFLERECRRKVSSAKLGEAVRQANETVRLWTEIHELCQAHPSPLNVPDLFVNMAPIVVLRGTASATRFYRHLRDEVAERVREGVGAIAEERYRLLWDNIAIWHHLYRLFNYFAEQGACFVVDTYTTAWSAEIPRGDLLESLAEAYAGVYLNRSLEFRARRMTDMIQAYDVSGFVMHGNRSCKPYSLGQVETRRLVTEMTGAPGLLIEADMCDSRAFAPEPIRTRIQAFIETLESSGREMRGEAQGERR